MGIPVALVRGPEKNFGTDDRLRAIHMWEDPTFLIRSGQGFTVAPSVEEFHLIPPGIESKETA